ncbi:TldD/PmbA family protein [Acetobacter sp. AN02]|uniref:TldD/PmbA family protein n=1 Tax=Acetobacter sp. AN02 TaxID=2894186 RepID=UPI00243448A2|nr:TldD/PmbA family protein [Acetobacter sp. AN02]MDG6094232.1 TldD/PmbA family protein [Acetobacter sp. AN02]
MSTDKNRTALVRELIDTAVRAGADAADAVFVRSLALSAGVRNGQPEDIERSETCDLGLRVFVGKKPAIVSATTLDPARFRDLADRAVAMARVLPEDSFAGLAENALHGEFDAQGMDLSDTAQPDTAELLSRAREAEDAAFAVSGVTKSSGAGASCGRTELVLASSAGFSGAYSRTRHSASVSVLAGSGTAMQRDYDYHSAVHLADLDPAARIGRSAGEHAVARLNPARPRTGKMTVLFDPRVAGSIAGHLTAAINGASVARGTSFLKDRLGTRLFTPGVSVIDDPTRIRGLASRPFDGEGVRAGPLHLVEDGVLQCWILDSRSARQLALPSSNGRAARGPSAPPQPSTSNLYIAAGSLSPDALMSGITEGIYITEMMGSSVSMLTGDYSRGASGFMIRDGKLAEPVAEFTVAGNLTDMFARLIPADDLEFRRGTDAPTLRIDDMSIAGV